MFSHRHHQDGGFTLVEILVVVVILGIASAIIIPQIGARDDLVASAAARVVMADLIYAQNRAIAMQKPHYVLFARQQYTVSDAATLVPITNPVSQNPYVQTLGTAGSGLDTVSLAGWNFGGPNTIGFDEMGSPFSYNGTATTSLGSAGTIAVQSGTTTLTISIEPFTGEATVQ